MKGILNCISFTEFQLYKVNNYKLPEVENAFSAAFVPFTSFVEIVNNIINRKRIVGRFI